MSISQEQARLKLGLNQTEMARAMGVHRNLWLKWERKEQRITASPSRQLKTLLWLHSVNMLDLYLEYFQVR